MINMRAGIAEVSVGLLNNLSEVCLGGKIGKLLWVWLGER